MTKEQIIRFIKELPDNEYFVSLIAEANIHLVVGDIEMNFPEGMPINASVKINGTELAGYIEGVSLFTNASDAGPVRIGLTVSSLKG
jgi:hypothetical protein